MNEYIRLDRQSDAKASLDEFCHCIERLPVDDSAWKYALISMHSALQGYICISLNAGNGFQTWSERHLKKWINAYENGTNFPDTKLDFFMGLYDKAYSTEQSITRDNIDWLNNTRNSLVHFNTDSFGIHRESAIVCCKEALEAIKLAPSIALGLFFYSEDQLESYNVSCNRAENLLNALQ